jgi:hypothetical protein
MGALMGTWQGAVLLMTLPGAWFVATHPTTVDAPSMLLALVASLLFPTSPYAAALLACLSGFIHERGPVFACLYTLAGGIWAGPLFLLVGLVAVGWWRTPARPDRDELVGRGLLHALKVHRPYVDFLDWKVNLFALRAVPFAAAYYGASPFAWVSLAVAWFSRVVGTDACRYAFWGAPMLIRQLPPDFPAWAVGVHLATFRRAI